MSLRPKSSVTESVTTRKKKYLLPLLRLFDTPLHTVRFETNIVAASSLRHLPLTLL